LILYTGCIRDEAIIIRKKKIYTNENGLDMMTKIIHIGKFANRKEKSDLVDYGSN